MSDVLDEEAVLDLTLPRDAVSLGKRQRLMEVLDYTGHSKHIWDAANEDEVEAARALYKSLTKKGYRAFHVKKDGEEGQRMDEFDPAAAKMIMLPQLRGG